MDLSMLGYTLFQAIKGDIRQAISQKARLDTAEAFVGRVVVRVETEGGEINEVVFNMPRGCGKIDEQERLFGGGEEKSQDKPLVQP